MFIAAVQLLDVFAFGILPAFLIFFVAGWVSYLYRINRSKRYEGVRHDLYPRSVSVIVPVVDEPLEIWKQVLTALKSSLRDMDSEVFVVCNGGNGVENGKVAEEMGFSVIFDRRASKRNAIAVAARRATKELTVILDSDTIVSERSIWTIAKAFTSEKIGGVTPKHEIFHREKSFWRRASDWMEDIRFNNSLRGLSADGVVNCLPGRLFAIRTVILKKLLHKFTTQKILCTRIETGDDRVLTQWMLEAGYTTLYDDSAVVFTSAPDTLSQFAKQRLRWARSSFREGMGSLRNLKGPGYLRAVSWYSLADIVLRWWFFAILVSFAAKLISGNGDPHFFHIVLWQYVVFGVAGFILNGYLRQNAHLERYPKDLVWLPVFLFANLFILTPVEWFGNLTFLRQGWLTRNNH